MTQELMQTFKVDATGLGNLSACYFYAYLLMQIPVGILLDKYSPRYLTTFAIFVCAISTFIFSSTNSLALAAVSRAFIGFGAAFAAVSCMKSATIWFPVNRFALVSGMCMTAAMLGAVFGQMPLALLVQQFNWRISLQIVAALGFCLGFIYFAIVRDKSRSQDTQVHEAVKLHPLLILKSKQAWLLSLYSGLAFAPVSVFGGLWGVPFLQQAYHLSTSRAALSVSWIFIGFGIGAPILGWLSDLMGMRKPLMIAGTLLATLTLTRVIYGSNQPVFFIDLYLFLFGLGASGFFISFAMIRECFPILLSATVLGFMNTFDSICEAVSEPIVGLFLDANWSGQIANGVHLFSKQAYYHALLLLPIYLTIAFILLFFIKETHCKSAL